MSMYQSIYLGPYVHCKIRLATRTILVFGCPNKSCSIYVSKKGQDCSREQAFCGKCGSRQVDIEVETTTEPEFYEVVNEKLATIGRRDFSVLVAVPNVRREGDPGRHYDTGATVHLDLGSIDMASEVVWFSKAFAPEIEKLKAVYDDVTVAWGFHVYYS